MMLSDFYITFLRNFTQIKQDHNGPHFLADSKPGQAEKMRNGLFMTDNIC